MKKIAWILSLLLVLCLSFSALAEKDGYYFTEEDGGTFRPLPINLEGGSPLPSTVKYNKNIKVYEDPTIRVERDRVEKSPFDVVYYYAIITIKDPSQLRTASAKDDFSASARTPVRAMAKRKNAVIAVNGDFCGSFNGNVSNNYILRQGTVFRDTVETNLDLLLIDEDGDFHILTADESLASIDKTEIDGKKVINALQFGPALVIDGQLVEDEKLLDRGHSPALSGPHQLNQRMGIAQLDKLTYMVICCAHYGQTLPQFRDLVMYVADVQNAYVLDGGNSAQMVFLNADINNINNGSGNGRGVTDIVYFASAWFKDE